MDVSLFKPDVSITLSEYMKICCKIQVIVYSFLCSVATLCLSYSSDGYIYWLSGQGKGDTMVMKNNKVQVTIPPIKCDACVLKVLSPVNIL